MPCVNHKPSFLMMYGNDPTDTPQMRHGEIKRLLTRPPLLTNTVTRYMKERQIPAWQRRVTEREKSAGGTKSCNLAPVLRSDGYDIIRILIALLTAAGCLLRPGGR